MQIKLASQTRKKSPTHPKKPEQCLGNGRRSLAQKENSRNRNFLKGEQLAQKVNSNCAASPGGSGRKENSAVGVRVDGPVRLGLLVPLLPFHTYEILV